MSEIKWIKITVNMFDDEKIKLIENLPQGDTIIVIWQKLICLAGKINMNGYIFLSENIPYSDEMLSITFNRPLPIIRLALKTFQNFSMMEIDKNGLLYLPNFEKHQNISGLDKIREQVKLRVKKHRENAKLLLKQGENKNVTENVTESNATDIDKDKDKEKERERTGDEIEFEKLFDKWFQYKKNRKQTYKDEESKTSFKNKLIKLSNNNLETAKEIIEQSMANNWAGIFELKTNVKSKKTITNEFGTFEVDEKGNLSKV